MDWQVIKQKIYSFYKDLALNKAEELILSSASEFSSDFEKALALLFLDSKHEKVKELLIESPEFIKLQQNFLELKELTEEVSILQYTDKSVLTSAFLSFIKDHQSPQVYPWTFKDYEKLYWQMGDKESKNFEIFLQNDLNYLVFLYLLGLPEKLSEEIKTHPKVEKLLEEISLSFNFFKEKEPSKLVWEQETVIAKLLAGEVLDQVSLNKEQFLEVTRSYQKHFLYYPQVALNNYKVLITSIPQEFLNNFIKELLPQIIENDNETVLNNYASISTISPAELISDLIEAEAFKCLALIISQKQGYLEFFIKKTLQRAETFNLAELFISYVQKVSSLSKISLKDSVEVKKICLKASNNLKNSFYLKLWDWIQYELALSHFNVGSNSFAKHYPDFYQEIASMEKFNLFYSLEDFKNYAKQVKIKEKQEKDFLKNVVEIIFIKINSIEKTLRKDLEAGINSSSFIPLNDKERVVLGAFLDKLAQTKENLKVLLNQFSDLSLEDLFTGRMNKPSIANLKGFYLGELKIAGLENFTGHSQQIKQIFDSLGFLVSPDIRKEIDHFVAVKEEGRCHLTLVESKNYQKILTKYDSRMMDIKNQKAKLDEVLSIAENDFKKQQMELSVNTEIYLNRGFTQKAQERLVGQKEEPVYDQAQGVVFNFENLQSVVIEEFDKLCQILKAKEAQGLTLTQINWDLYSDKFYNLSKALAMVEEDKEEVMTSMQASSQTVKEVFTICAQRAKSQIKNIELVKEIGRKWIVKYQNVVHQRESNL